MEKQVLLNKLIERVNTMTDEQIAKVILDVWSNTDVASLLKQNEELKKQVEELREVIKQKWYTDSVDSVDIVDFKTAAKEILNDKQKSLDLLKSTGLHNSDGTLKTEEELKFFNASTGNWMTAEKLQQKSESKLKSLEEHNKQTFDAYALANNLSSGFACPKCGEELFYSNPKAALCTHPPQKSVCCNKCNYTGYVYC